MKSELAAYHMFMFCWNEQTVSAALRTNTISSSSSYCVLVLINGVTRCNQEIKTGRDLTLKAGETRAFDLLHPLSGRASVSSGSEKQTLTDKVAVSHAESPDRL